MVRQVKRQDKTKAYVCRQVQFRQKQQRCVGRMGLQFVRGGRDEETREIKILIEGESERENKERCEWVCLCRRGHEGRR